MASAAAGAARTSGFLITIDTAEKARWKRSAAAAGLTMAEYVRRAVRQVDDAPTVDEIAAARRLATEINAAAERMAAKLDRTIGRIEQLLDPVREDERRSEILAQLEAGDVRLDLDALANAAR